MNVMKKDRAIQIAILKILGGTGYMAWVLQLLLLVALYFERFYHSGAGQTLFPTSDNGTNLPPESVTTPSITLPTSGFFTILMVVLGVALVGVVIYVVTMRYVPAINKTATKVVHEAAEQTVRQVERTGRKKLPVRKRRALTARVAWWIKLCVSIVPLGIVLLVVGTPLVSKQVAVLSMGLLSLWAVLCFTAQAAGARIWRRAAQTTEL